ncbi:MAG: GNAT family N-acetyltransferase [Pirellulaceae bacterium]
MSLAVRLANLDDPSDQAAILELIDMYARDPLGDDAPLAGDVRERLLPGLRQLGTCRVFLAQCRDEFVGIAVCFLGYSSFRARPLVNIHDLAVTPGYRGKGVGKALLAAVEQAARSWGCCRLTLEVRHDNTRARQLYRQFGFESSAEPADSYLFWKKSLEGG